MHNNQQKVMKLLSAVILISIFYEKSFSMFTTSLKVTLFFITVSLLPSLCPDIIFCESWVLEIDDARKTINIQYPDKDTYIPFFIVDEGDIIKNVHFQVVHPYGDYEDQCNRGKISIELQELQGKKKKKQLLIDIFAFENNVMSLWNNKLLQVAEYERNKPKTLWRIASGEVLVDSCASSDSVELYIKNKKEVTVLSIYSKLNDGYHLCSTAEGAFL